jgi:hypothetical protein
MTALHLNIDWIDARGMNTYEHLAFAGRRLGNITDLNLKRGSVFGQDRSLHDVAP